MNSDSPNSPGEELEARLTALLLGELSEKEAASLRQAIARDAELSRLHDRLKQAIGLVRETVTSPEQAPPASSDAPKLSPARRTALLTAFKVVRPKEATKAKPTFVQREWLAVAAMIAILCLVTVLIIPNFVRARSAAQRPTLYFARDESWAEAAAPATPLARRENGRVSVSGQVADSEVLRRVELFSEAQPQNDAPLTVTVTDGPRPQRQAAVSSISSPSVPPADAPPTKPKVYSRAGVEHATTPSPPPTIPLLTPAPAEAAVSDERVVRQLAAIALPASDGDALSTSAEGKNNVAMEPGVNIAPRDLLGRGTSPDSNWRGSGRGGGSGLDAGTKPMEYAGASLAGGVGGQGLIRSGDDNGVSPGGTANFFLAPGLAGNTQPTALAPSAKPADRSASLAFGIAPVPAVAPPGQMPNQLSVLPQQDDEVRFKETDLALGVSRTNAVVSGFFNGAPAQPSYWHFGGIAAGGAGQTPYVLQRSDDFIKPALEPDGIALLGDQSGNRAGILNGTADGYYRFHTLDSRAAGAKDAVEQEKKLGNKLADLSKSEHLDPASGNTTLQFDAEGKGIVRDLQRESELKSDVKLQVAQQSVDGSEVNKRYKIALPESELGEAKEKLRVATGPVVISEILANEPATRLPAQKPADVALAVEESLRRKPGQSPTPPAKQTPAAQVTTVDKLADVDSKLNDRPQGETPKGGQIELTRLTRELENLRSVREKVEARVLQEKVDAAIPRSVGVEIIDAAEAKVPEKSSLWGRVRGLVSGDVERTARIAVQKDATEITGLAVNQSIVAFDPYWVQTESEKIQSKMILNKVIEQLNLNEAWAQPHAGGDKLQTEETYRLLKKKIEVRSDPKTGLIDIRAKSDSPDEAARIANAVAQVYRDSRIEQYNQLVVRGMGAIEGALVEQGKEIARVEQELERRKKELNPDQADVSLPKLAASAPIPQSEVSTAQNSFSTFSLNVSDVSFKLAAAALEKGQMPDPATVRSEEFINAFDYRDPEPKGSAPIAFAWERARYPFAHDRDLMRFSVKTAASGRQPGRPLNLVLLLDNSGSMERADRIRIRQECLRVLASQLQPQDRVSVVAFARTARLWVDGLPGNQAGELSQRVGTLAPEGGTNLEDAMNVAYRTALKHFLANGVNRVALLTDGAANLGDVEPESLKQKVEAHRKQGVALDCFGIGWDGLNDELLEALSRNGDGRYGFVNTPEAATTEFASQLAGALKVAASDVKVQVQWNPRRVTAYRQIGYAKHQLKKEQFRDNTVDAAEIGAAEAGNALYTVQVNPRGEGPVATVRVRFKVPGTGDYREHEWTVPYEGAAKSLDSSSPALRLAASASAFSEWLVSNPFAAEVTPDKLLTQMNGVPETWLADPRPKKLEWMIRQARSVAGK